MLSALSTRLAVPREHGFWAMLLTVLITALLRTPVSPRVACVALAVLGISALLGGRYARPIRKSGRAQLASSVALAFAGIPVELAGGVSWAAIAATTTLWAALFLSSSLLVRAAFARAARASIQALSARQLTALAIAGCSLSALTFYGLELPSHTAAAAVGTLGIAAVAVWRASVKQLKAVGIALASAMACAGWVLAFWGT